MAMMAYGVLGRGMLSAEPPKPEEMATDDIRARLPRFQGGNIEKNLRLRSALEAIAHRKNVTLAQLAVAWSMAQGVRASFHHTDTWSEIARAPRGERARCRDCAHRRRSCGNRPHRAARCRFRYPLPEGTNAAAEFVRHNHLSQVWCC